MSILDILNFKMTPNYIDLNCDVGEGVGNEKELLPFISSCNIACGGHTGDKASMASVVQLAKENKVLAGAHPSYPDVANFGRVSMDMDEKIFTESVNVQIRSLVEVMNEADVQLHHIKPHGALYNDLAKDHQLALCFLKAVKNYKNSTYLYVPYASVIERLAVKEGFRVKYEGFADRNYEEDYSLVSRKHPKALIIDKGDVLEHIIEMVNDKKVTTINGKQLSIFIDTLCIHGDTPSALEIVLYLTQELPNHNICIKK